MYKEGLKLAHLSDKRNLPLMKAQNKDYFILLTNRLRRPNCNQETNIMFPEILPLALNLVPDAQGDGDVGTDTGR